MQIISVVIVLGLYNKILFEDYTVKELASEERGESCVRCLLDGIFSAKHTIKCWKSQLVQEN